jgi:hypothetical protein
VDIGIALLPGSAIAITTTTAAAVSPTVTAVAAAAIPTTIATAIATVTAALSSAFATTLTAATAFFARTCFARIDASAKHFLAIDAFDGLAARFVIVHFDEAEAARAAGHAIANDARRSDIAESSKGFAQIVVGGGVRDIADVNIHDWILRWSRQLTDYGLKPLWRGIALSTDGYLLNNIVLGTIRHELANQI